MDPFEKRPDVNEVLAVLWEFMKANFEDIHGNWYLTKHVDSFTWIF